MITFGCVDFCIHWATSPKGIQPQISQKINGMNSEHFACSCFVLAYQQISFDVKKLSMLQMHGISSRSDHSQTINQLILIQWNVLSFYECLLFSINFIATPSFLMCLCYYIMQYFVIRIIEFIAMNYVLHLNNCCDD